MPHWSRWIRNSAPLAEGGNVTADLYREVRERVLNALQQSESGAGEGRRWADAASLLDSLATGDFQDFLTEPGYAMLDAR